MGNNSENIKTKIIIVDEKDNVIGYKNRDAVGQNDIYRVSALWVTNSKGDSLLSRRVLTKSHDPGKWGCAVAGTVEEGETYELNIYKEAEEEIGLRDVIFQSGSKERITGKYNFFCQWYTVKIDEPEAYFILDKSEVEDIRWFRTDKLMQELKKNPGKFLKNTDRRIKMFCR